MTVLTGRNITHQALYCIEVTLEVVCVNIELCYIGIAGSLMSGELNFKTPLWNRRRRDDNEIRFAGIAGKKFNSYWSKIATVT
jgi:hypothetical protein